MDASFGGAGFGKNGTNATSPSAAAAVTVAKLLEMVASPVNFNDPFSLFSEWIAKGRVDQLALQEVLFLTLGWIFKYVASRGSQIAL